MQQFSPGRCKRWIPCLVVMVAGCNQGGGFFNPISGPVASSPPVIPVQGPGFNGRTLGNLLGTTVQAAVPPPPLSGGTLLVSRDGTFAVVSDPERDRIAVVDVAWTTLRSTVTLAPGDEPGRAVEDNARRVHVVLRGGGAVTTLDLATGAVTDRTAVCPLPRGIAYDPTQDAVLVACAGGELVTLPASGGAATRTVSLDSDLRDVLVVNGTVYVTRFREAELLTVSPAGQVIARTAPATQTIVGPDGQVNAQPEVAWRTIATPSGGIAMLHQYAQIDPVQLEQPTQGAPAGQGSYGNPAGATPDLCAGAIVQPAVAVLGTTGYPVPGMPVVGMTLAIDMAISPDGTTMALASAGNLPVSLAPQVIEAPFLSGTGNGCAAATANFSAPGQVVAVAYLPSGELLVQTREPAGLFWTASTTLVTLATNSREDTGHTLFHADAGGGLACASCHPEGTDDGHIWTFDPLGARRTQSPRGNILARAPFHWDGDLPDMSHLVSQVFSTRMNGGPLGADRVTALGHWLNAEPALPAPAHAAADDALVARGQQLFNDPAVGCANCHSGPLYTNNALVNVGTGGTFKVPSLLAVIWRAPYLHDGCAPTLHDRFISSCGGGDLHGHTSQLDTGDIKALGAFLATL